jgi:hypothetical protein
LDLNLFVNKLEETNHEHNLKTMPKEEVLSALTLMKKSNYL